GAVEHDHTVVPAYFQAAAGGIHGNPAGAIGGVDVELDGVIHAHGRIVRAVVDSHSAPLALRKVEFNRGVGGGLAGLAIEGQVASLHLEGRVRLVVRRRIYVMDVDGHVPFAENAAAHGLVAAF